MVTPHEINIIFKEQRCPFDLYNQQRNKTLKATVFFAKGQEIVFAREKTTMKSVLVLVFT